MLNTIRLLVVASIISLAACTDVKDSLFDVGLKAERTMSNLELQHITVADHDWTYLDSAAHDMTKPTVLMLHGFAVDKDNWLRFARSFKEYRVIVPDLPGHGETSYDPEFTYDFAQQTIWLDQFIDALGLKNIHIMGNSMGGGIALMYSYVRSERVTSITLIDAAGVHPPKKSDLQTILDSGGKNPLIVNSIEDFDSLRHFAMAKQPFLPWPAADVLARRAQARNEINTKIFADIHAVAEQAKHSDDNLRMLQHIEQPVLILWGEKDRALDVSSVAVFEHYLPNSRSIIFPDLGHAPMLEAPDDSAALVLEFIQSVEQQPKSTNIATAQSAAMSVVDKLALLSAVKPAESSELANSQKQKKRASDKL